MTNQTLRSQVLRIAAALPKGSSERRHILAMLAPDSAMAKVALKKDTETFIAWALQRDKTSNPNQVEKFIEKVTGREPIQPADAPKARRGPLETGEKVLVDRYRNSNEMNVDECEVYHDQVGVIDSKTPDGLTVKFDNGQTAFFDGHKSGKATGLYRWTPKPDYQEGAVSKSLLVEMVYLKGGVTPPPQRDIDSLREYVEKGMARGESRSKVYYSGYIGKFAYNKGGQVYFVLSSQQRDRPTAINPAKGKMLYIGIAGRRPGGWKAEAQQMGLA